MTKFLKIIYRIFIAFFLLIYNNVFAHNACYVSFLRIIMCHYSNCSMSSAITAFHLIIIIFKDNYFIYRLNLNQYRPLWVRVNRAIIIMMVSLEFSVIPRSSLFFEEGV